MYLQNWRSWSSRCGCKWRHGTAKTVWATIGNFFLLEKNRKNSLILTCNISKKGIFFHKSQKKFFLFFMGDESPNAHETKSMIGLVLSTAQQLTLQSSKVQNCQHWGQLLGGSPSTFLIALGKIISIFIYIFGFHWKILPILMFGLHFGLGYFCIFGRNSWGRNGAQKSRLVKFFNKIQKYIYKLK